MNQDPDRRAPALFIDLTHRDGGAVRLTVAGEVDLSNAERLRSAIDEAFETAPVVELEMDDVPFIDSHGIRAMTTPLRCGDRRLVVASASTAVRRLLTVTGLAHRFETQPE